MGVRECAGREWKGEHSVLISPFYFQTDSNIKIVYDAGTPGSENELDEPIGLQVQYMSSL